MKPVAGNSMSAVSETDLLLLEEWEAELLAQREHPHNVLIEGSVPATEAILALLLQIHPDAPIVFGESKTTDDLGTTSHTLIVRNVGALCGKEQQRLLESLSSTHCPQRVISTCEHGLFAHVTAGHFDETLYYRLNVVLLRLDSGGQGQWPARW